MILKNLIHFHHYFHPLNWFCRNLAFGLSRSFFLVQILKLRISWITRLSHLWYCDSAFTISNSNCVFIPTPCHFLCPQPPAEPINSVINKRSWDTWHRLFGATGTLYNGFYERSSISYAPFIPIIYLFSIVSHFYGLFIFHHGNRFDRITLEC